MLFNLNEKEIQMLHAQGIDFDKDREYTEDEALELLDKIRDVEVFYSQDLEKNEASYQEYIQYGDLADKIQNMIPEE